MVNEVTLFPRTKEIVSRFYIFRGMWHLWKCSFDVPFSICRPITVLSRLNAGGVYLKLGLVDPVFIY